MSVKLFLIFFLLLVKCQIRDSMNGSNSWRAHTNLVASTAYWFDNGVQVHRLFRCHSRGTDPVSKHDLYRPHLSDSNFTKMWEVTDQSERFVPVEPFRRQIAHVVLFAFVDLLDLPAKVPCVERVPNFRVERRIQHLVLESFPVEALEPSLFPDVADPASLVTQPVLRFHFAQGTNDRLQQKNYLVKLF